MFTNSMSGNLSIRFELVWAFSSDGASVQNLYHVVMSSSFSSFSSFFSLFSFFSFSYVPSFGTNEGNYLVRSNLNTAGNDYAYFAYV